MEMEGWCVGALICSLVYFVTNNTLADINSTVSI